jgi:hypothetical protein
MVTGCDEMKAGEVPPAAMSRLAQEVAEQGVEPQGQRIQEKQKQEKREGRGGGGGGNRQQMAQEGAAAAVGGYSESE